MTDRPDDDREPRAEGSAGQAPSAADRFDTGPRSQDDEVATWAASDDGDNGYENEDGDEEPLSRWETPAGHLLFDVARLSRWLVATMAVLLIIAGVNVAGASGFVRSLTAFGIAAALVAVTVVLFLLVRSGRRFIFAP